ncbi:MAG: sugar ABC transporter substrate-binding protein [Clostridiales bacterium]|nr:sugar ABC transporter substrate-binding protein [Clostridiales bacterium]
MKKTLLRLVLPLMLAVMMLPALPLSVVAEEALTVTVFVGEPRDQPTSDNKVFKMIEEEFGLKFEFEFLAGDLNETLGVKIAGQDYADLMDGGNYAEKLIEAGAFINLMDYISEEETPNIYQHVEPYLKRLLNEDGELFIIPNYGRYYNTEDYPMNYVNGPAFFLQKKVLAWDNYPMIKTMDEYFDLIERYVAANPTNEQGQPNEGFAILCEDWRAFCLFNPVQHLMGRPNDGDVIVDIDDNYKTEAYCIQDYAKHYYQKLNEMFHKGLISQDTFVMNYDQYLAKISSGTVVGMFDQYWNLQNGNDALRAAEMFDSTYQGLPLIYTPEQAGKEVEEHYLNGTVINVNRGFGISVNAEHPERLVQFMEKMLSDEWQKMIWWGIEGEDYYMEDGRFLRTYEQIQDAANMVWRNKNSAYVLTNSMAKKQGEMDDGNKWDPMVQPECYFLQMNDYDKAFLEAYGMQRPLDFFNDPIELAPYGEAWQIDVTVDQDANDAKLGYQDVQRKMLPQVIMAAPEEFDAKWDEYVAAAEAVPVSDFVDFMQESILELVEQVTGN